MAYSAVVSLLQSLEHLLLFPCLILEIKQMQAKAFNGKVDKALNLSRRTSTMSKVHLRTLIAKTEPLALTVGEFIETVNTHKLVSKIFEILQDMFLVEHRSPPRMLEKCPKVLEEMGHFRAELMKLLGRTTYPHNNRVEEDSRQPSRAWVVKLLQASDKLRHAITISHRMAMEITVLCQDLRYLLSFLESSSNEFLGDHQVVKSLRDLANKAGDIVDDYLFDNPMKSKIIEFIHATLGDQRESLIGIHYVRKVVRKFFDGESGICQGLLQTLQMAHSVRQMMRKMYGKRAGGKEYLQSGNASLRGSLQHDSNKQHIVVGLDDYLVRMLDQITGFPSRLEIVTIVGMGGIGKTTLAKNIFDHPYTIYHFYCRAWVAVSQVYQVRDLLLGILSSVSQLSAETYSKTNDQLAEVLYRSLKGRRYLIVMDDMWSAKAWNDVKRSFPNDKNGSRVIVTTRLTDVAIYVNPKMPPHFMSLLSTEESWKLMENILFGEEGCPLELVDVGKYIAKRCQGLPLSIVVVAGLLCSVTRTLDSWRAIASSISSFLCTDAEHCLEMLAFSYNHLPPYLKVCFQYMGAFPEDCEIEVQKLIHLWIAEGFLDPKVLEHPEAVAVDYLEDLIGRSLVLVGKRSFDGKIKTCILHDLLRELCLIEAQKENFLSVIKGFSAGIADQRRLSLHKDSYLDVHLAPEIPYVRSFLYFDVGSGFEPDILFFQLGFKLLKVLDVIFLRFETFPVQILELVNLSYLGLMVTFELPKMLSRLKNLQTLVIHGPWTSTDYAESPNLLFEYWSMPKLRHLYITVACCLRSPSVKMDISLWPFTSKCIQTVSRIRFASCTREVFISMPSLRMLALSETKEDYEMDWSAKCLKELFYLQELELLKLYFYRESTKKRRILFWDALPANLRKLTISCSYQPWQNMISIALLPKLEVLKLKNYAFQGPKWEPTEGGFRVLKHLLVEKTDLVSWEATSNHFPCLEHLVLKSCKYLTEVPYGITEISTLKRIELHNSSESGKISALSIEVESLDVVIKSDRQALFAFRITLIETCSL